MRSSSTPKIKYSKNLEKKIKSIPKPKPKFKQKSKIKPLPKTPPITIKIDHEIYRKSESDLISSKTKTKQRQIKPPNLIRNRNRIKNKKFVVQKHLSHTHVQGLSTLSTGKISLHLQFQSFLILIHLYQETQITPEFYQMSKTQKTQKSLIQDLK